MDPLRKELSELLHSMRYHRRRTVPTLTSSWAASARILRRLSARTASSTSATFLDVARTWPCPARTSLLVLYCPERNSWCHSNTVTFETHAFPYTTCILPWISAGWQPLAKGLNGGSLVLFGRVLHLERCHTVPVSYNAPIMLHNSWSTAGGSWTQPCGHLRPVAFASSAANRFHLNSPLVSKMKHAVWQTSPLCVHAFSTYDE
jgi:hypothetical protein